MKVFDFESYKEYVVERLRAMPKRGHGQFLKIAHALDMHTTMVSQIFKGPLNLSLEQAQKLCGYFGFNELETDYFMNLVQLERAGTKQLKNYFQSHLKKQRDRALNLSERLAFDRVLDEKSQAVFYSNWYYSGIRLLSSIPKFQNADAIAEHLGISMTTVNRVVEFLLSSGLCKEENGKLAMGESRTYVGRDSPLVSRHHTNWRMRVLQQVDHLTNDELMFTNPVTLSKKDFEKIREDIVALIERVRAVVDPSPSEELACLNIDWVKIRGV